MIDSRASVAGCFDAWAAFLADEEATRFLGGVQSRPLVWRTMMCMAGAWFLGRPAMFSVIERSTGRWVGRLGPWTPEGWPGTEVGWGIARECWGRGYATEGALGGIGLLPEDLETVLDSPQALSAASLVHDRGDAVEGLKQSLLLDSELVLRLLRDHRLSVGDGQKSPR